MSFKRFQKLQKYQGDNKVIPYVYKKGEVLSSDEYDTWFDCYEPYGKWYPTNEKMCERIPFEDGMVLGSFHKTHIDPFELKYNESASIDHPDYEVPDCVPSPYPDYVSYSIARIPTTDGGVHSVIIEDKIENLKNFFSNLRYPPNYDIPYGSSCIAYGKWYFNLDVSDCKSLFGFYRPEYEHWRDGCPEIKAIYFMKPFSDKINCLNEAIAGAESLEEVQFLGLTGHYLDSASHFIEAQNGEVGAHPQIKKLCLPLLRGKEDGSTYWHNFLALENLEYLDISSLRLPVDIDINNPTTFTHYFWPYLNTPGLGANYFMLNCRNLKTIKCTRRTKEILQAVDAYSLEHDLSYEKVSWVTGFPKPLNVEWIISDDEEIKDVESVPEPMIFDIYTVYKFFIDTDNDGIYETSTDYRRYEFKEKIICDESSNCQYCTDYDLFEWIEEENDYICEEVRDEKCKGCYPFKIRITNGTQYFRNDITLTFFDNEQYDLTECETLNQMFSGCTNLKGHIDLSEIKSQSWYNTGYRTFYKCENITSVDLSNWFLVGAIRDVQFNFSEMFKDCKNLEYIDASNFRIEVATKTPATSDMFWGCTSIKKIKCTQAFKNLVGNLNVDGFNTLNDLNVFEIV